LEDPPQPDKIRQVATRLSPAKFEKLHLRIAQVSKQAHRHYPDCEPGSMTSEAFLHLTARETPT
jgi:hypothetical protein